MISLRTYTSSFTAVALAALALIGCGRDLDGPTGPTGLAPTTVSRDGRPGDAGNSAKHGSIATRVLLDAQGNAVLDIRTGTYDDATNSPATPSASDGWFDKLQYKILDARGKQVLVQNIDFKSDGVNVYQTTLNLCSRKGDAGDDDGDKDDQPCTTKWGAGWSVLVQANLKGVGGDGKKTDVVRDQATAAYLPDVDISAQQVWLGQSGNRNANLTTVTGVAATFSVDFPNTKSINGQAPTVGANMMCAVYLDDALQTTGNANAFAYSSAQNIAIAPGQTVPCVFSLKVPFGPHTIHVSAQPMYPGDYDPTNNTTADFTVTSAPATGNPDVALGLTQADTGAGVPNNLDKYTGSSSIRAQEPITFWQYADLLGGQAPSGPVTCTLTITNTGTSVSQTVSGTASVSSAATGAPCKIPYTFAAAGTYTITPLITLPNGDTDANLANNTGAAITLVVAAPLPEVTAKVNDITFTDAAEHISAKSFVPGGTPGDTVHSGDAATYAAAIDVSALLNTPTVNTISCKVFIDGVDKTSTATWVSGPTLSNVAAGTATCSISQAFVETDNALHPHTIGFSITTGIKNDAPVASTSATGTINDVRRVDVQAGPLQTVINNATGLLDTVTTIKQGSTVTIQAPFTNLNPATPTTVTCDSLRFYDSTAPFTNLVLPATDVVQKTFTQTITTATVTVPAGGTAACSYSVQLPTNLAVGAIPLISLGIPTASSPLDPVPANNQSLGTMTVQSNGAFTDVSAAQASVAETWYSTWLNNTTLIPTPVDSLTHQSAEVNQLALLVVPNSADLGSFTITGTVMADGHSYGTGAYTAEVLQSPSGVLCQRSTDTGLVPAGALNSKQRYHAAICAAPAPNQPGFQIITVDYTQDLATPNGTIIDPTYPLFYNSARYTDNTITNNIQFRIALSYHLTLGNTTSSVSALVTMGVPAPSSNSAGRIGSDFKMQWTYQTTQLSPNVVSPAP